MTTQTTPQSSPNDPSVEKKKALEQKLKLKKEALAKLQAKIFNSQLEIMKLESQKETLPQHRVRFKDTEKVFEISDSGSEWGSDDDDEEFLYDQRKLSCWQKRTHFCILMLHQGTWCFYWDAFITFDEMLIQLPPSRLS